MAADDLATQGTRTSIIMISTYNPQNIPLWALLNYFFFIFILYTIAFLHIHKQGIAN